MKRFAHGGAQHIVGDDVLELVRLGPSLVPVAYCGRVAPRLVAVRLSAVTCKVCLKVWRVRGGGVS